jgi:HSP20 family protein
LWDYYETIKINEEDGKKFIEFDLPGVRKEDVKISVEDKVLHLSAERKDRKWNFERTVTMPKSIDVTSATAKLNDGVLKVYFKESIGNKVTIPIE